MDNAERQAAFRDYRVAHDGMLGIQQNDSEDLVTQVTQGRMIVGEEVTTGCDLGSLGQWTSECPLPHFKGRLQLGRFGLPHTWNCAELFDSASCKSGHIPESIQN